ncbi:MAG TPA: helix-turn-helix transcriptional regulator [Clostridia bacterium]|nr:helix-turn-helix transcriptional regulator [Clostridia bacterium]
MPIELSDTLGPNESPGERLQHARIQKGMTITDLAQAAETTIHTIMNIERGRTHPSLSNLNRFARILEVNISYLGCFEELPENTLGQKIKKARLFHGHTQSEVSRIVGVNPRTLGEWENGRRQPLPENLEALHGYLEILKDK